MHKTENPSLVIDVARAAIHTRHSFIKMQISSAMNESEGCSSNHVIFLWMAASWDGADWLLCTVIPWRFSFSRGDLRLVLLFWKWVWGWVPKGIPRLWQDGWDKWAREIWKTLFLELNQTCSGENLECYKNSEVTGYSSVFLACVCVKLRCQIKKIYFLHNPGSRWKKRGSPREK